jgi:hypothetical protein
MEEKWCQFTVWQSAALQSGSQSLITDRLLICSKILKIQAGREVSIIVRQLPDCLLHDF